MPKPSSKLVARGLIGAVFFAGGLAVLLGLTLKRSMVDPLKEEAYAKGQAEMLETVEALRAENERLRGDIEDRDRFNDLCLKAVSMLESRDR
jgi:hypothetical protein